MSVAVLTPCFNQIVHGWNSLINQTKAVSLESEMVIPWIANTMKATLMHITMVNSFIPVSITLQAPYSLSRKDVINFGRNS
jgi:hypothetical protein